MGSARRKMCKKVFFTVKLDLFKVHLAIHRATAPAPFGWLRSSERWCQNHLWTAEPFALASWHRQSTFARCRGRPLLYFEACPIKKFSHKNSLWKQAILLSGCKNNTRMGQNASQSRKKCKKIIFCTSKCRFLQFFDRVRDWNGTESVRSAATPAKPDGVVSE